MNYTYLLINFSAIFIPFLFSFHPKLSFHKTWHAFFPAVIITGILFILWDITFTYFGVWGFNLQYLTGYKIANLPVEEILFFLCIPYACVFTYHCFKLFLPDTVSKKARNILTIILIAILLTGGIIFYQNVYTAYTFFSLSAVLAFTAWYFKRKWLVKFYIVYAVLLLPFLIVNGILTGLFLDQPVVWYNEMEIIGLRILTIPVEDIFYGMELILLNVLIYEYLLNKKTVKLKQKSIRP